ncbi:MAG TPA: hypothetical protein VNN13_02615 [Methylomirabilota bacterium]|nr:hypothetical protein [Methylomirabilota bacterium]
MKTSGTTGHLPSPQLENQKASLRFCKREQKPNENRDFSGRLIADSANQPIRFTTAVQEDNAAFCGRINGSR